jgi:hypothetical protein
LLRTRAAGCWRVGHGHSSRLDIETCKQRKKCHMAHRTWALVKENTSRHLSKMLDSC